MIWWDCACCSQFVCDQRRDCIGDGIILVCPICNGETIVRLGRGKCHEIEHGNENEK